MGNRPANPPGGCRPLAGVSPARRGPPGGTARVWGITPASPRPWSRGCAIWTPSRPGSAASWPGFLLTSARSMCAAASHRVVLLAPYLTAAAHRTKAEIEELLAQRFSRPDAPSQLKAVVPAPLSLTSLPRGQCLPPGTPSPLRSCARAGAVEPPDALRGCRPDVRSRPAARPRWMACVSCAVVTISMKPNADSGRAS